MIPSVPSRLLKETVSRTNVDASADDDKGEEDKPSTASIESVGSSVPSLVGA